MTDRNTHMRSKKQPVNKAIKILWWTMLSGFSLFILILLLTIMGVFGKLPSMHDLENPQANLASEIYADDGKTLMGKVYAENRTPVEFKDISKNVIDALISTEDERFYDHSGIDAKSIARAVFTFGRDGGGSTITQQLAKNILGQGRGSMWKRSREKLKEWIVALKLERNFTKQEILALYLNRVPWGNIFGIRNASRTYFQKEPSELEVDEAAMLVGMLKGPGQYDPVRHPKAALERRNTVIEQMVRNKTLEAPQAVLYKQKPLITKFKKLDDNLGIAPYFRMVLTKRLVAWCKEHKNPKTGNNYDLYRDGLKIYTSINAKMQLYAEEAVVMHMSSLQKKFNSQLGKHVWDKHEDILNDAMKSSERWKQMTEDGAKPDDIKKVFNQPVHMKVFAWNANREVDTVMSPIDSIKYLRQMMQTAFMAMDPVNGEVKAWVGGIDFKWFKYDHATTNRQVGSTFKPFLYTLALMDAGVTPDTYIGGRPITLANKTISGKGGTMANCLAWSKNSGAWDLMDRIGPKKAVEFAHAVGIKSTIPVVPSIALGSADLTLEEMMHGYTMFPNRGFSTEPIFLLRIEDKNGNVLETFQPESKQVIGENDAYTMYKMMQGVIDFGTGHSMRDRFGIQSPMGGKTGTTNDNTDGWFIGYTPQLQAGAWIGCEDRFLHISWTSGGNEMAMPEFAYFMQKVYADKTLGIDPHAQFQKPADADNNPIWANEKWREIIQNGEQKTDESDATGNGDAGDYEIGKQIAPVESDFEDKPTPPAKDTSKKDKSKDKNIKQPAIKPDDKSKKPPKKDDSGF
jgi:penicillin-binding protein 1A